MSRFSEHHAVIRLAWPLAVGLLSFTVMGVVDTLLMGKVSTEAQAGVGLATIVVFCLTSLFRGLISGAQSLVAAADGAKNRPRMLRGAGAGLLIGMATGGLGLLYLEAARLWLVPLILHDAAVQVHTDAYLVIRVWGVAPSMMCFGLMAGLQGAGDTRARMWASLAGNVVNIGLDLVLIFGVGPIPAMGAAGAAIATVAGIVVMLGIYALRFWQLFGRPRMPGAEVLRSALSLGLPSGVQQFLGTGAFLITTVFIADAGAEHLAANEIMLNIISLSFLPGVALGEAAGILVGRHLGAGHTALAGRALHAGRAIALIVMGLCGLVFAFGGYWLSGFFNPDPAVRDLVVTLLLLAAVFQLFDACTMVQMSVLRAAGDTQFSMILSIGAAWGVALPLAWLFGSYLGWGALGAWAGIAVEIAVLAVISGIRVRGVADGRVGRMDLLLGA